VECTLNQIQQADTVLYSLHAGVGNANRNYLLLGSVTGTLSGVNLPGGNVIIRLDWDLFTDLIISSFNVSPFLQFQGQLDANGEGIAVLQIPALGSAYDGFMMYFAYFCDNPFDFVSNPVQLKITP